jgi:hypothetical protein
MTGNDSRPADEIAELARLLPVPADRDLPADRSQSLREHLMNEFRVAGPALPARRPGRAPLGIRWRLVAAGLVAAIAAGGTAAALTTASSPAPPARLTVTELAYRAAAAASRGADVRPGQWVYREVYVGPGAVMRSPGIIRQWATADNQVNAFYLDGRLIVGPWAAWLRLGCMSHAKPPRPQPCAPGHQHYLKLSVASPFVRYAQLSTLPASPRQLISVLAARNPNGYLYAMFFQAGHLVAMKAGKSFDLQASTESPAFRAFSVICSLLSAYVMPPRLTAELYQALGDLPGVEIHRNAADVTGRHGIAFYMPARPHSRSGEDIIVNPRTYQLMAFGTRHDGAALLRQALVAGPGIRPGHH